MNRCVDWRPVQPNRARALLGTGKQKYQVTRAWRRARASRACPGYVPCIAGLTFASTSSEKQVCFPTGIAEEKEGRSLHPETWGKAAEAGKRPPVGCLRGRESRLDPWRAGSSLLSGARMLGGRKKQKGRSERCQLTQGNPLGIASTFWNQFNCFQKQEVRGAG